VFFFLSSYLSLSLYRRRGKKKSVAFVSKKDQNKNKEKGSENLNNTKSLSSMINFASTFLVLSLSLLKRARENKSIVIARKDARTCERACTYFPSRVFFLFFFFF